MGWQFQILETGTNTYGHVTFTFTKFKSEGGYSFNGSCQLMRNIFNSKFIYAFKTPSSLDHADSDNS